MDAVGKIFQVLPGRTFFLGKVENEEIYFFEARISEGDFIIVLETEKGFCKFLVLSGKHAGKISWERELFFKFPSSYFREVEIT